MTAPKVHSVYHLLRLSRFGRLVFSGLAKILALLGDSSPFDGMRGCSLVYVGETEEEKNTRGDGSSQATGLECRPNGGGSGGGDESEGEKIGQRTICIDY